MNIATKNEQDAVTTYHGNVTTTLRLSYDVVEVNHDFFHHYGKATVEHDFFYHSQKIVLLHGGATIPSGALQWSTIALRWSTIDHNYVQDAATIVKN